jgi:hypothetical protein
MVLGAARTTEPAVSADGLRAPTFRSVLLGGLPAFLREGFLPLGAFYVGWRAAGLGVGIGASALASTFIYLLERRAGRDGLMVRLSLGFVVVQSAVGLISNSTIVYLATPVVANVLWALAFLVSAAIRRPLAGALACAWYPFSDELRATQTFKRVFGVESFVWGVYLLARGALRLGILLTGHLGAFLVVNVAAGTPLMLALVAWSIQYSIRRFEAAEA